MMLPASAGAWLPAARTGGSWDLAAWATALQIVFLARRDDLLELETRRKLHDHVGAFPGLHLRELARAQNLDVNHAKYHLLMLEKHGLVSSKKDDRYVRFYPVEAGRFGAQDVLSVDEKKVVALLRRPIPLHVTLLLLEAEDAGQQDLLERVAVKQATLSYHLKKMVQAGMLEMRQEGRSRRYRLQDAALVSQLLLRYKPPDALVRDFLDAWESLEL